MRAWLAVLLVLPGCVSTISGSTYSDGRFWWSNVRSASDPAGGPRQDVLIAVDRDGRIVGTFNAAGIGTLQAALAGLSGAVVTAGGQVAGSALVRPARNTTNVEMNVQGTGGAGGTGGTSSTSSSATGGAGGAATGGNVVQP